MFVFLWLGIAASQDRPQIPTVKVLQVSKAKTIHVPPFNYFAPARCDDSGNVFFHADTGDYSDASILKISRSGNTQAYTKSASDDPDGRFVDFAVAPSGGVFMLENIMARDAKSGDFKLVSFDSDGTPSSSARIEIPANLLVSSLAVFDDGVSLVRGTFTKRADARLAGKKICGAVRSLWEIAQRTRRTGTLEGSKDRRFAGR